MKYCPFCQNKLGRVADYKLTNPPSHVNEYLECSNIHCRATWEVTVRNVTDGLGNENPNKQEVVYILVHEPEFADHD